MTGLLDHIFHNIKAENLEEVQIRAYIDYLDEIIQNSLPVTKELEYQTIKRILTERLNKLHQEQIQSSLLSKDDTG